MPEPVEDDDIVLDPLLPDATALTLEQTRT
jgi:hypothetical protein